METSVEKKYGKTYTEHARGILKAKLEKLEKSFLAKVVLYIMMLPI